MPLPLFTLARRRTTLSPFSIACFLFGVPLPGWAARALSLSFGEAALAGALSALSFFVFDWIHQWGHAQAARRVASD